MILIHRKNIRDIIHKRESTGWQCDGTEAYAHFLNFGKGEEKKRWFQIVLDWRDVELIINVMAEKGSPHAKRFQKALNLMNAIEDIIHENNKI